MSDKQQFNVYLPRELVRRIKHAAIDEGLHLSDVTEQALGRWLEEREGVSEDSEHATRLRGRG